MNEWVSERVNEQMSEWTLTLESEVFVPVTIESGNTVRDRNGGSVISRHFGGRTGQACSQISSRW